MHPDNDPYAKAGVKWGQLFYKLVRCLELLLSAVFIIIALLALTTQEYDKATAFFCGAFVLSYVKRPERF